MKKLNPQMISILNKLEIKFSESLGAKPRPWVIIYSTQKKAKHVFSSVLEFLEKIRGTHTNPLELMFKHYVRSVYVSHARRCSLPYLTAFRPTSTSEKSFLVYLAMKMAGYDPLETPISAVLGFHEMSTISKNSSQLKDYWLDDGRTYDDIKLAAKAIQKRIELADKAMSVHIEKNLKSKNPQPIAPSDWLDTLPSIEVIKETIRNGKCAA
jgi:hypothetical protein